MKVYLCGGMRTNWQDDVKDRLLDTAEENRVTWIDPRDHHLSSEEQYTSWDCFGIEQCDILFAYLEADNPGVGLAFEIGYASALGKTVIFVEQAGHPRAEYFGLCRKKADVYSGDIDSGTAVLQRFLGI